MQVQTLFRDLNKSEALTEYIEEKIASIIEHFVKNDPNAVVTVRLEMARPRTAHRRPSFLCEMILKPNRLNRTIKISKSQEDIYAAVNEAAAALRTILSRRSAKKAQHRRHDYDHEMHDLVA